MILQTAAPEGRHIILIMDRLYIVSFADSEQYRYEFKSNEPIESLKHSCPLDAIADRLYSSLKNRFPDEPIAYYTTPKVVEISWLNRDKYKGYPLLDESAVEEIETLLATEIEDQMSLQNLNSNAPFDSI